MKKLVFPLIILLLALSACVPAANTAVEAELRATLVGANVQLTVQANEIDGLHTKVLNRLLPARFARRLPQHPPTPQPLRLRLACQQQHLVRPAAFLVSSDILRKGSLR